MLWFIATTLFADPIVGGYGIVAYQDGEAFCFSHSKDANEGYLGPPVADNESGEPLPAIRKDSKAVEQGFKDRSRVSVIRKTA